MVLLIIKLKIDKGLHDFEKEWLLANYWGGGGLQPPSPRCYGPAFSFIHLSHKNG
jgi:hypothetical protein